MSRTLVLAALLAAFALAAPSRAVAGGRTPTAAELEQLDRVLGRAGAVRVRTDLGHWLERRVGLGPEGVRLPGGPQPGEVALTPPQPATVAWEHVVAIETQRGGETRGLVLGAIGGLVLGGIYAALPHPPDASGHRTPRALYLLAGAGGGALFGATIGIGYDPWREVWPGER